MRTISSLRRLLLTCRERPTTLFGRVLDATSRKGGMLMVTTPKRTATTGCSIRAGNRGVGTSSLVRMASYMVVPSLGDRQYIG